ncbi:peroxiredoxin family protein [Flavilitoribacter nigricans]|uniref:Thioredoxin domain-containing protein n=1 Tax=Flavilitoribacter nigricans (strain ATCC 23147 / DSM 23189 / NBRC 102662 / NCIMB 1420 / SS-2) TaxID=1122177 RepID=A0A2D0N8L8_FLAN2|nr:TlpA disulfide reductase family protein [Flavilitoribacter nigricans]PHN04736.1 hypothetical protein CRP01_19670 [Flavilitoribacter nigricans DSM 23189 = NBRC 102662]
MKKNALLFGALLFVFPMLGQVAKLQVGDPLGLTEIQTRQGTPYSLDDVKDKVIVMNFWMIGCKGCLLEQPYLNELAGKYRDREDIVFWSVTPNQWKDMSDYLRKHPITWEIKDGVDFSGISGDKTFEIKCMPTTLVIDKQRNIRYFKCDLLMSDEEGGNDFMALLDSALAE